MGTHDAVIRRVFTRSEKKILPRVLLCFLCLFLLAVIMILNIRFGTGLSLEAIWNAITQYDAHNQQHQVIHDLRLPRVLAAVLVGAALGISGTIMQMITHNPLAAPDTMGVNAGAAFTVLITLLFLPSVPQELIPVLAFAGGIFTMFLVWGISSVGSRGVTPVKLALAGVAVATLMRTMSEGLILAHSRAAFTLTYLLKGSLAGIRWDDLELLTPWTVGGIIVALLFSRTLNLMRLGDEVAIGLGVRVPLFRMAAGVVAVILACSSVAVAGPITFVGLVIPHMARLVVGIDQRWVIPFSGIFGALLLTLTDWVTRVVFDPQEVTVSILTALIGAPFFIVLARSRRVR
ncbi:iron ABC transporter permease [Polycladomyces sp. WAk]|uniref:Iron ABC transporter permease n=1 Tax=Polycladomyces zharkentensis TaxID=2807616 RepID=A0ABS2WM06_9BACL|nr:iron ABC transporter permease [Polycladomyces sp. WAk]MBN2910550.1 iron ABC transporter permease [Polycladomyces sp. WAk]